MYEIWNEKFFQMEKIIPFSCWNLFQNTTFKIQLKVGKSEKKNLEKIEI